MADTRYEIEVKPESTLVEVRFASSPSFTLIEQVLGQLRNYIADGYQIKLFGYINKDCNYLRAFMLALSLFGKEDRISFINKAKFSKAERRRSKILMQDLRRRGYSAKQISEELGIPLKTAYRWISKEAV
ncbi:MAG: helix-turn-helix domain-containing protein [Candidatus Bathyarchaeia archaeon]|nr:helix-turn-helix domain-containing protein [Candidatus Bathyarchaeota archaeon]